MLGKRVPPALRVLLLALAVIDDLGAIIVIAVFYSAGLNGLGLLVAAGGLVGILLMQRFGVRSKLAYVAPAPVAGPVSTLLGSTRPSLAWRWA